MAKKKKILPKDFEELLKQGDLEILKAVFNSSELDARGGYGKQTALAFDKCPHELAKWLVEQGADLQAADTWGNTPLHNRSRSIFGNIKSLLDLGADVQNAGSSVGMPLHAAADSHNVENTALLLQYGAKPDVLNNSGYTPLELALRTCRNIDIVPTVGIAKLYLEAGVPVTLKMKEFVAEVGKQFEFHRAGFNKEHVDQYSNALDELYGLFDVQPAGKRAIHDGKSLIKVKATAWQDQHEELWQLLVPSGGAAATIQGEVIRISGRIAHELDGNGGINWNSEFKKMAVAFLAFVQQGNPLPAAEMVEVQALVKEIQRKAGDTGRLCALGVQWVLANPAPIALPAVAYRY